VILYLINVTIANLFFLLKSLMVTLIK